MHLYQSVYILPVDIFTDIVQANFKTGTGVTMEQASGKHRSIMGEAPRIILVFAPALVAALATSLAWPRAFDFLGRFRGIGFAAGMELAAIGIPFWASAAWNLIRAYRAGTLATRGAYSLCRNPIFSWWIFSVLPALALCLDSWIILALSPLLYSIARPSSMREEQELEARFGDDYRRYRDNTRAFLPLPRFRPFTVRRYAKAAGVLVFLGIFALAVLVAVVSPIAVGLGATAAERGGTLPGDELIGIPWRGFTQAISINAPAEEVWKWLVQVGYRRAGWYNIDAINRFAAGDYFIDGHGSSDRIVPELQNLAAGDRIDIAPGFGFTVAVLERPTLLVMGGDLDNPKNPDNAAWTFAIVPTGDESCRMVSRFRMPVPASMGAKLAGGLVGTVGGAIIQQPAMFAGIRKRAEGASR
jgi:protein-S-isoprenylcysteine O-methyltransferase Ste14